MKAKRLMLLPALLLAAQASGQSADMAAERERIANQRIQAEAERRAREEEERLREAETATREREVMAAPETPATPNRDMSRILEQIRTLGELRDAGYLTEDEFERIKSRILADAL